MTDFLLELLSEEIPARMQERAREDLARLFEAELAEAGIEAEDIETFSTPRRLALIARGLPGETQAVREERRGPRADAPDKAIEGFLRSTGLTRDQLEEREEKKGAFLYAVIDTPGRRTRHVLAEAIPNIIRNFPWPKSMRWGEASESTESLRWVRPLQGIVAIFGDDLVECEVDGIASGVETVGHRFHHPGRITVGGAFDYAEKLEACHVIVDPKRREGIIRERANALAEDAGLTRVQDPGLVEENAGLTEWPEPLLGGFDEAFLDVAPEAITLAMRTHQKYFACRDGEGNLAPNFICVANIEAGDGGEAIIRGNERVLAARLADAKFFWDQDLAIPLEEQAKKLDQIVFHEKLGTVADKVDRVANLARWLVEEEIVRGAEPDKAEQAARLAKADLVTGMVGEFPELQGVMGGYYAAAQGADLEVAAAIRDHYKPVGQGDEVPTAPVTVAVSLADKLDTIAAFFVIGERPSGSRDPFALRRAAIAVISLVVKNDLRFSLRLPLDFALGKLLGRLTGAADARRFYDAIDTVSGLGDIVQFKDLDVLETSAREASQAKSQQIYEKVVRPAQSGILDFFADRLKVQQRESGIRHDSIDAILALGGEDDLVRLLARVRALQDFLKTADGANLLAGYKRAANILKKEGRGETQPSDIPAKAGIEGDDGVMDWLSYDPQPEERVLLMALEEAETDADTAIAAEDFAGAMAALAGLRRPIDGFFDNVTVNDDNPKKREQRLQMLERMRDAVHRVADFSKIEG